MSCFPSIGCCALHPEIAVEVTRGPKGEGGKTSGLTLRDEDRSLELFKQAMVKQTTAKAEKAAAKQNWIAPILSAEIQGNEQVVGGDELVIDAVYDCLKQHKDVTPQMIENKLRQLHSSYYLFARDMPKGFTMVRAEGGDPQPFMLTVIRSPDGSGSRQKMLPNLPGMVSPQNLAQAQDVLSRAYRLNFDRLDMVGWIEDEPEPSEQPSR